MTTVRERPSVLGQAVSWGNVAIGIVGGAGGVLVALGLLLILLHRRR